MESLYYFAGPAYLLIPNLLNKQLREIQDLNKKIDKKLSLPINTIKHLTAIARLGEPGQEKAITVIRGKDEFGNEQVIKVNNRNRHIRAIITRGNIA